MWTGYLDDRARNESLCAFLDPYELTFLHTSGHASPEDLKQLYETINPNFGLIPIHSETPEMFTQIIPNGSIIMLDDGKPLLMSN